MLTKEKITSYQKYGGDLVGYLRMNKQEENIFEAGEWAELGSIIQDLVIIRKGLAAPSYMITVDNKLNAMCDNVFTIGLIKELALLPLLV